MSWRAVRLINCVPQDRALWRLDFGRTLRRVALLDTICHETLKRD